ncbi:conserved hypothetical protein [Coccidioides posadasii str. Silveira]|uniref:Uncharacterized protein n=1 Tax=Coccidioides posadasii (strain RMSCC 757 / Silveira) TaxID=443226 RepID=E9DG05_COCPS|nr:conserved hypothetical protein [Coccidioides posadasii str. Silveira]
MARQSYNMNDTILLLELKHLYKTGFMVKCADEIIADYEEQVLITEVKSNRYCTICIVLSNAQENLTEFWPIRIYKYTLAMLQNQQDAMITRRLDEIPTRIKEIIIMIDILHQLLK